MTLSKTVYSVSTLTGEHEAEEVAGSSQHHPVGRKVSPLNHQGHITEGALKDTHTHTHTQLHTTTHRSPLRCTSSLTHLFPQVVHDSHDAGQLSVLLFGGTLPLALLLGAWRLLWRSHPRHVGPRFGSADTTTLPEPLPAAVCSAALCCRLASACLLASSSKQLVSIFKNKNLLM